MGVLTGLKPERVFYYFEQLCAIPHGSYNVQGISDYLVSVAKEMGLEVRQDEELNVVIKKGPSAGYEDVPAVMIQGHMDMVAVHDDDKEIDMLTEAIDLIVEDGFVRADRTTLGGDDGIAVAIALAILEDDSLPHPALEVVITTQEEVGMEGAIALDCSDLKSKYLINIDNEQDGHFLCGCAGGVRATSSFDMATEAREGSRILIEVKDCMGGHSGAEIHKGRANANLLLGRLLYEVHDEADISAVYVDGGTADNAIAVYSEAGIICDNEDVETVIAAVSKFAADIANEYKTSDPGIKITATLQGEGTASVFTRMLLEKVIFMLVQAPNGVQTMSADLPGLVESSLNLGILRTDADGVHMTWAIRSSVKSLKTLMKTKLTYMTEFLGGDMSFRGDYPEWPYNPASKIGELGSHLYKELFGKPAIIEAIHAGVECGLLAEKMPGLDMICIGPDLFDIHTSRERMDIASVGRIYELVCAILRDIKNI